MNLFKSLIVVLLFSSQAFGQSYSDEQEEGVIDYESIVRELTPTTRANVRDYGNDPLALVQFHIGVGFTNSVLSLTNTPEDVGSTENLKGVQAKFGIDLLSPLWRAEGGIANYETSTDNNGNSFSLKEFDLSLVSISPVSRVWGYKVAGGLSARYLDFKPIGGITKSYTTPAANLQMGILAYFSNKMTISTDLAYRRSLTTDSIDQSALDLSIRFDGHF